MIKNAFLLNHGNENRYRTYFESGLEVQLTAILDEEYLFCDWSGDLPGGTVADSGVDLINKKKLNLCEQVELLKNGAGNRIRTGDLLVGNEMLYH